MLTLETYEQLRQQVSEAIGADAPLLAELRADVRPLRDQTRRIYPRSSTSVSLVATDGGNNQLQFDPFMVQAIRVVDSSDNEHWFQVLTPTSDVRLVSSRQFGQDGQPCTALGDMMRTLGVGDLPQLSHMIRLTRKGLPVSPSWVQVYRELVEWAILFKLVRDKDFGTDVLLIKDGLLRSKVFAGELFSCYRRSLERAIQQQVETKRRRVYVAGVAKHSNVFQRYRLAMALEGVLATNYPCYVEIPRELEEKTYVWAEYARGDDRRLDVDGIHEVNKFVAGKMFFVKFGGHPMDPIWPVDLLTSQVGEAQAILGFMLADAQNGFPIPFYPRCLQKAHENAAMVDLDFCFLQDQVFSSVRNIIDGNKHVLDTCRLQDQDPARSRY